MNDKFERVLLIVYILLLIAKLFGWIVVPWVWMLAPLWIPIGLFILITLIIMLCFSIYGIIILIKILLRK